VARFTHRVIETRGHVSDADLAGVRGAGYTDTQILAIVTLSVRALMTNYINNVNQTVVDIPSPAAA
jgi:alkylhydroperoxidase family enzyme